VPLVHKIYEGAPTLHCTFCTGYLLKPGVLERIVARQEVTFGEAEVLKALAWRKAQPERSLREAPGGLVIPCPECGHAMSKAFHLMLTRVVIDRCSYDGTVWLDAGELETIQILVEEASRRAIPAQIPG
jgi:Zn-finger nucleic acid-binding protein